MSHSEQDLEQVLKVTRLTFVCLERTDWIITQQKRAFHYKCTFNIRQVKVFGMDLKC